MHRTVTFMATALLAVVVAACTTGGGASPSPSVAAPTVAPSVAASVAPSPSASPDACAIENLALKTPGVLTIGADNPAFPPYYDFPGDGETATDPWESGDPTNGRGFESATAYAIAEALGFAAADVTWIPVPFNNAIQPGEKDFDLYLTQVSYSDERAQAVDMSEGYFDQAQAVVSLADNPIADVTTVAGLKAFKLAAPVATTSLSYITDVIVPAEDPSVYDTLDAAIQAVSAGQVDGVVVDLPTAFYITAVQLEGSTIVGSLPQGGGVTEHFSAVLDKDSPLTACVNQAIAAIKADGTLAAITDEWITGQGAPAIAP
ncbi:MAG: ABC transporter substrate-binding protein [Candidatus Limnocylindrales bacterium]